MPIKRLRKLMVESSKPPENLFPEIQTSSPLDLEQLKQDLYSQNMKLISELEKT